MTYTFEFRHPEIKEGSMEEIESARKEHVGMAKMAVHMSIESIRKMAANGELGS